ncbi:MAG: RNA polymerase sigma factor [Myxococcota bacterium]
MGDGLGAPRDADDLVRLGWAPMLRYLRHAGLGDAAQDVAQEVFACAMVRFEACPRDDAWRRWLFRIGTYKLKEHRRAHARAARKHEAVRVESVDRPVPRAVDDAMVFQSMLDSLTELEREAVVLRYAVGMSGPEIADALGVPVHRVRGRLLEARRRLRRIFEKDEHNAAG